MSEEQQSVVFEEWDEAIARIMEERDDSFEKQELRFLIGEKLLDFLEDLKGELDA